MARTDWTRFGAAGNHSLDDFHVANGSTSLRVDPADQTSIEVLTQSLDDAPKSGELRTTVRFDEGAEAMVFFRVQDADTFYVTTALPDGQINLIGMDDGEEVFDRGSSSSAAKGLPIREFVDVRVQFWEHEGAGLHVSWDVQVDGEWVSIGPDVHDPEPALPGGGIGVGQFAPLTDGGAAGVNYDDTTVAYPTDG